MFTPTNLFKAIQCPEGERCELLNCIFSHELRPQYIHQKTSVLSNDAIISSSPETPQERHEEPPSKRRKVTYERLEDKPLSRAEKIRAQLARDRVDSHVTSTDKPQLPLDVGKKSTSSSSITSLERAVSPPRISAKNALPLHESLSNEHDSHEQSLWSRFKQSSKSKNESLNPRMLNPAPESHAKRVQYLQLIHSNMTKLNRELGANGTPIDGMQVSAIQTFMLTGKELITLALDEEENIARTKPKVYANSVRHCIAAYQKMTIAAWLAKLKQMSQVDLTKRSSNNDTQAVKLNNTGLPAGQEHLVLPHLVVQDQASLKQYGYISKPPSEDEANAAREAVEFSRNHEECDRCGTRFKVFPDRDPETGRLTSNGPCRYHWARKSFPTKQKTDNYTGSNEPIYPCCGQSLGTGGCTEHSDHVFKCSAASRLAAVMPFLTTPENATPRTKPDGSAVNAVVFDCEMGYTTNGMELIRLTAVSWPGGENLVDVLVRPLGAIIDLNTRFSGVKPEDLTNATPFVKGVKPSTGGEGLTITNNPATARQLLCDFLKPDTPLIGHAIDNDLNTTRLCHPTIIDTVLLFSHPRGLPFRYGLKMLTKKHLDRSIQTGGSAGHDSREDAVATGDLVRVKVADVWRELKDRGWKLVENQLIRPANDVTDAGWHVSTSKSAKLKPVAQSNGLAKILEEARSSSLPEGIALTSDFLEA